MNHPLQPLNPMQRLGWLQHFTRIRCTKSFSDFRAGQLYPLFTATVPVSRNHSRARCDGLCEDVVLTGWELLVKISVCPVGSDLDHSKPIHRFLATPQSSHPWIHNLDFLISHFAIPEILDQAALNPAAFAGYQEKLRAMES